MDNEKLVNLNLKDTILSKWRSKIGYSFNFKDLEELEYIINYYDKENQELNKRLDMGKEVHKKQIDFNRDILLRFSIKDRTLKELRRWLEDYYDYGDYISVNAVLNKLYCLENKSAENGKNVQ